MSRSFHDITDEIIAARSTNEATRLILECIDIGRATHAAREAEAAARKVRQLAPNQPELERQAYQITLEAETAI